MLWSINVPAAVARSILITVSIAIAAVAISVGHHFVADGGRVLSVQTGSMVPTFRPGDAVIVWRTTAANLRVGDIVAYHSLRDPNVTISHRIVAIYGNQLTTRGDALKANDPAITASAVMGRVSAVAPNLGSILSWIRTPLGLAIAVYLPAATIIVSEAMRLSTGPPKRYQLAR